MSGTLETHNINRDFNVIIVRTNEMFREFYERHRALLDEGIASGYPKLVQNGLGRDEMAIFLVGVHGAATDPDTVHYDKDTGILSFELIYTKSRLFTASLIVTEKRPHIEVNLIRSEIVRRADTVYTGDSGILLKRPQGSDRPGQYVIERLAKKPLPGHEP